MTYDCLVLRGGGAKGAYSAGVSKALFVYRKLKNIDHAICYIGTSSGALNPRYALPLKPEHHSMVSANVLQCLLHCPAVNLIVFNHVLH